MCLGFLQAPAEPPPLRTSPLPTSSCEPQCLEIVSICLARCLQQQRGHPRVPPTGHIPNKRPGEQVGGKDCFAGQPRALSPPASARSHLARTRVSQASSPAQLSRLPQLGEDCISQKDGEGRAPIVLLMIPELLSLLWTESPERGSLPQHPAKRTQLLLLLAFDLKM